MRCVPLAGTARNDHITTMDTPTEVPQIDHAWPRLVTATPAEIRYAEELRRRIEERYLTNLSSDDSAGARGDGRIA